MTRIDLFLLESVAIGFIRVIRVRRGRVIDHMGRTQPLNED
mgnify:CR=1 FL=1